MAYSLAISYAGQALIDGFNFVSIPDPTDGFVAYQNLPSALAYGYATVNTTTNKVKLSVDSTNSYDPDGSLGGRPSIRIESKQPVNQGLVIGDFAHMPGSVCGTWPAFWLYGPNWPDGGEIDIIEGANMVYRNLISAHTGEVCTLPSSGLYTGTQQYTNCTYDEDIGLVEGCNYAPPLTDTSTYGDDFNAVGGGVYAMDWTSESIRIWHFPRNKIPQNIVDKKPDPSTWGTPQALFGDSSDPDSCDVGLSFYNMSIVLDIDFCGDYAGGSQWGSSSCYAYASSCEIWVGNSPSQFANSFWEFYIRSPSERGSAAQFSHRVCSGLDRCGRKQRRDFAHL
ncbi:hypothetical protein SLS64_008250 [Diaporthe eres]|uniref:GH16 domain-containing protein n=1 Tax=Diaporthe eres TaxID=83184 RepID=A0ABR1PKI1_DIAER